MENYQSISEGLWIEIITVPLSKKQRELLTSNDEIAKASLRDFIKTNGQKGVSLKKTKELTEFYETKKPILKDTDTYQLISINVNENLNGIINCRINNEHKQIRF